MPSESGRRYFNPTGRPVSKTSMVRTISKVQAAALSTINPIDQFNFFFATLILALRNNTHKILTRIIFHN